MKQSLKYLTMIKFEMGLIKIVPIEITLFREEGEGGKQRILQDG